MSQNSPLEISLELGVGAAANHLYIQLHNKSDALFPGNKMASLYKGVHFLIKEVGTNEERLLSWRDAVMIFMEDESKGIEPGETLEISLDPTVAGTDFKLQPNRSYELTIGYGYLTEQRPVQRLSGLILKTDAAMNIEVNATPQAHSEFMPKGLEESQSPEKSQPAAVQKLTAGGKHLSSAPVPGSAAASEKPVEPIAYLVVLLTLIVVGMLLLRSWRKPRDSSDGGLI